MAKTLSGQGRAAIALSWKSNLAGWCPIEKKSPQVQSVKGIDALLIGLPHLDLVHPTCGHHL